MNRRMRDQKLRRTACVVALLAVCTAVMIAGPAWGRSDGLRPLGVLPILKGQPQAPKIVAVDSASARMYAVYDGQGSQSKLVEYDLTDRIPTVRRFATIRLLYEVSKARVALDAAGGRLFFLDIGADDECEFCSYVRVIDLRTLTMQASYNATTLIPNFLAQGLTYSPADRLLYLTGSNIGFPAFLFESVPLPYYPLGVAAFDPDQGSAVWWKVVPQCLRPLSTLGAGALTARSRYENALYIACIRADVLGNVPYPGESGLARVWFTPRANPQTAALFPVEYFPISGTYTGGEGVKGLADYDPVADRFYMLSQSELTPGAWVFDGRNSAWVGFVAAAARDDSPMGVDPESGHLFMATGEAFVAAERVGLVVADGRANPVSQGRVYPIPKKNGDYIMTDPATRRVFLPVDGLKTGHTSDVLILLDETDASSPVEPTDYDALTTDVPEGQNTEATFSGSLNGYGSRAVLVGGTGGITTAPGYTAYNADVPPVWDSGYIFGLASGDRGMFLGHVGSVDLRNSGAVSSAQAITPDTNTANDYVNQQNDLFKRLGDEESKPQPWPWPVAICNDGEGKPAAPDESNVGTEAKASCDLKKGTATAKSSAGGIVLSQDVSIGSSSFDGSAIRSAGDGIVTTASAVARDIRITVPGAGTLKIGRIGATARTVAKGRKSTAQVEWTRDIDHVSIVDASGKTVFSCASQCDTSAIEAAIHEWAGAKIAIKFPTPRTRTTPGGAFAEVQKTDAAYHDGFVVNNDETFSAPAAEILVYNDFNERSRILIQLAAIQASSIYGISLLPTESILPPNLPVLPPPVGDILAPDVPLPPPVFSPPTTDDGSLLERVIRSSRFLVRSPGDALLIALIASLTLAAAAACWRRRSLLGLLDDFGTASDAGPPTPIRQ